MADFVMVSALVTVVFVAAVQIGLALHVRNTLIWAASEGARYGARADSTPQLGVVRAQDLIRDSLSDGYAQQVSARPLSVDGMQVVQVTVVAPLPMFGLVGPSGTLTIVGRAFAEGQ